MSGPARWFALLGAVNGFLAVAAGAFGAHALKTRLDDKHLAAFETGARYHMFHALALLAVAWLCSRGAPDLAPARLAVASGWAFTAGTVLFSGTLYAYALTGTKLFALITPVGGLCLLAAWALLAGTVLHS